MLKLQFLDASNLAECTVADCLELQMVYDNIIKIIFVNKFQMEKAPERRASDQCLRLYDRCCFLFRLPRFDKHSSFRHADFRHRMDDRIDSAARALCGGGEGDHEGAGKDQRGNSL